MLYYYPHMPIGMLGIYHLLFVIPTCRSSPFDSTLSQQNLSPQNYQNWLICVEVIVCYISVVYFGTECSSNSSRWGVVRTVSDSGRRLETSALQLTASKLQWRSKQLQCMQVENQLFYMPQLVRSQRWGWRRQWGGVKTGDVDDQLGQWQHKVQFWHSVVVSALHTDVN